MKNKWNKSLKQLKTLSVHFFFFFNWKCLFHNCHCREQELSKSNRKFPETKARPDFSGSSSRLHPSHATLLDTLAPLPQKMRTEQEFLVSFCLGIRHCRTPSVSLSLATTLWSAGASEAILHYYWSCPLNNGKGESKVCGEEDLDINFQIMEYADFLFSLQSRIGELWRGSGLCRFCSGVALQIVHEEQSLKEITSSKRASFLEFWSWNMWIIF